MEGDRNFLPLKTSNVSAKYHLDNSLYQHTAQAPVTGYKTSPSLGKSYGLPDSIGHRFEERNPRMRVDTPHQDSPIFGPYLHSRAVSSRFKHSSPWALLASQRQHHFDVKGVQPREAWPQAVFLRRLRWTRSSRRRRYARAPR